MVIGFMSENKKIYFISDVHLGYFRRDIDILREGLLLKFLDEIKNDCLELVIVGDLFDYWFDYKTVIPRDFYLTLAKLKQFKQNNIEVTYLMGNHDFGHYNFFRNELGIEVIEKDITKIYFGKKFYLSHGDGKAYNDHMYLLLKKILRNQFAKWLYSKLHPNLGIKLASHSSRTSRQYTSKKEYGNRDGMMDFAKSKIENENYDFVVMGHRHIAGIIDFGIGKYVNLGEWLEKPCYGVFDGNNFNLVSLEKNWDF